VLEYGTCGANPWYDRGDKPNTSLPEMRSLGIRYFGGRELGLYRSSVRVKSSLLIATCEHEKMGIERLSLARE